jgi:hypothetical protein
VWVKIRQDDLLMASFTLIIILPDTPSITGAVFNNEARVGQPDVSARGLGEITGGICDEQT